MKDKVQTITFYAVCVFLLCYFTRIFNMPNELTLIAGALLCLVMVIQQKKFRIDIGICLLAITMASYYVIINGAKGLMFSILYIPLVIYELGNYAACVIADDENQEKKLLLLIFILVAGFSIHGILNSYMWYAGYAVPGTRRWPDFWSLSITPGTQHVAYFMPIFSCLVGAIIYLKKRFVFNVVVIFINMFFCYTSLVTKSRMAILIFAIVVVVQIIYLIVIEKENIVKSQKIKWLWVWMVSGFVVIFAGVLIFKDNAIITAFVDNMQKDGGIFNNVRFTAQRLAIQQLFVYPMGGFRMDLGPIYQVHNVWLDIANAAGLIPFFSFVIYTIYVLYEFIGLLLEKNVSKEIKVILLGIYITFLLFYYFEPALEASVHLMTPWLFVNGIVHGRLKGTLKR